MTAVVLALLFVGIGIVFSFTPLIVIGILSLSLMTGVSYWRSTLTYTAPLLTVKAPEPKRKKKKGRHKLIEAAANSWDNEDWTPYLKAMEGSGPLMAGAGHEMHTMDPLRSIFHGHQHVPGMQGIWDEDGSVDKGGYEHTPDIIRNILPFSQYGRGSVVGQIFMGFPLGITNLLFPQDPAREGLKHSHPDEGAFMPKPRGMGYMELMDNTNPKNVQILKAMSGDAGTRHTYFSKDAWEKVRPNEDMEY